jgi:hypothetical protein
MELPRSSSGSGVYNIESAPIAWRVATQRAIVARTTLLNVMNPATSTEGKAAWK